MAGAASQENDQTGPDLLCQFTVEAGQERAALFAFNQENPQEQHLAPSVFDQDDAHEQQPATNNQETQPDNMLLAELAQAYVAKHGIHSLIQLAMSPGLKLCCYSSTPTISENIANALSTFKTFAELDEKWENAESAATILVHSLQEDNVPMEHISHFVVDLEELMHAIYFEELGLELESEINPAYRWRCRAEKELVERSQ